MGEHNSFPEGLMNGSHEGTQSNGRGRLYYLVLLAFLAIGAFLLLCPLLHFFMHGSHGADAQHGKNDHRS